MKTINYKLLVLFLLTLPFLVQAQATDEGLVIEIQSVREFLISGVDLNIQDYKGGLTALMDTPCEMDIDFIESDTGRRHFGNRVAQNQVDRVIDFIICGANPDRKDVDGFTLLHEAVFHNQVKMVKLLLGAGANPDVQIRSRRGMTALHKATKEGYIDIVKILLSAGANPNIVDTVNRSPLHYAIEYGHVDLVRILIDAGVHLDISKGEYWSNYRKDTTVLHMAITNEDTAMVKLLLNAGANPDIKNWRDWTPLHRVAWLGSTDLAKLLLDAGADPYINLTLHLFERKTTRDLAKPNVLQLFDERGIEDLNFFQRLVR